MDSRTVIKRLATMSDSVVRPPAGVVILIFHRVGGGSISEVDLDAAVFEAQLSYLGEHHRVLTIDQAVAGLRDDANIEGVVLTFDDGTTDFAEVVVPALVRHGLPATLYAATKFIDEGEEFPWGAPPVSWVALRDACSTGLITVGSHTHSHWLMDRLDPSIIDGDLDRSIELIGDHLGVHPAHFAYPKALPGSAAAEIAVRRRFRSAALANSRVNRHGHTDLHRLWRTPVQRSDTPAFFAGKARGGLRLEGELRNVAARVKYRGMSK